MAGRSEVDVEVLGGAAGGGEVRGRCAIAGLLRTTVYTLGRALYPLTWWCSGTRRRQQVSFKRNGWPIGGGRRGPGGSGRGRRGTGSLRDRRAVAHNGLYSGACSLSVDVVVQRHAAPTTSLF